MASARREKNHKFLIETKETRRLTSEDWYPSFASFKGNDIKDEIKRAIK